MTRRLDLRGLKCPLPALRTRKALAQLVAGERIEVLSDDPLAAVDVPNAAREAGGEVVEREALDRGWTFTIRRVGA